MSDTESKQPQRIEVITSIQRRRRWSVAEKIRIVQECEQPGMSFIDGIQFPNQTYPKYR